MKTEKLLNVRNTVFAQHVVKDNSQSVKTNVVISMVCMHYLMQLDANFDTTIKSYLNTVSDVGVFCIPNFKENRASSMHLRLARVSFPALTVNNSFASFEYYHVLSVQKHRRYRCLEKTEMKHEYHVTREMLF